MSPIPEELQRLWSERDRQSGSELPVITLEDSDESSGEIILDALDESENTELENTEPENSNPISPMMQTYPVLENVKCFPSYNLISDINLAKYESNYERNFFRTDTH